MNASVSGLAQPVLVRLLVSERLKMLAYIQSLVRNEDLAEDLFQDVCMLAVEKAATIRDENHLLRWLRTTARYLAMNAMQKRGQRNQSLDPWVIDALEPAWQRRDADDMSDRADALRQCVDLLPRRAKTLIEKRYVAEMSYEDLAAEMSRPVASLYVTFSRIFSTLNECISARLRLAVGGTSA